MSFPKAFVFSEVNQMPTHCYFLQSGIGSVVAVSPKGARAEVGLFGRDGMTPTTGEMQSGSSPHSVFMQVTGHGLRIKTARLMEAVDASPGMATLFARYTQTLSVQTSFTALSNAVHHVEERLARWLLMCHDRTGGNAIELTHDYLAIMLAVRRPSLTTALHILEGKRLIISALGVVTVRDREALERFAADAYGSSEREYRRLIGELG